MIIIKNNFICLQQMSSLFFNSYVYSSGVRDPYFSNVAILMHGDGNIVDSSDPPLTYTTSGSTVSFSSTSPAIAGTSYISLVGPCKILTSGTKTACSLGSNDFTIEFFVKLPAQSSTYDPVISTNVTGAWSGEQWVVFLNPGATPFPYLQTVVAQICTTTTANVNARIPFNQWTHVAFVRLGSGTNNISLYVNGVRAFQSSYSGSLDATSPDGFTIGNVAGLGTNSINMLLSEIRVTNGVCRYTGSTLVIPTSAFPNS